MSCPLFLDMYNNNSSTSLVMLTGPRLATKPAQPDLDNFYLRQRRTIEIIELVEVAPPSRDEHLSVPCSSSAASSSSSSSSEDEESVSSYCSSDMPSEHDQPHRTPNAEIAVACPSADVAWHARMRRVESWRDAYAKAVGAEFAPSPKRTKRKGPEDDDDDTFSRSSKRSRQTSARSEHSCSACDASFASRQSLQRHGRGVRTNEACRAAVEYGFE